MFETIEELMDSIRVSVTKNITLVESSGEISMSFDQKNGKIVTESKKDCKMKSNSIYKIRDKKTGLFSKGGTYPRWGKKGKAWTSLGALRLHLRQYVESYDLSNYNRFSSDEPRKKQVIPDSWEILEFSLEPSSIISAKEVMNY